MISGSIPFGPEESRASRVAAQLATGCVPGSAEEAGPISAIAPEEVAARRGEGLSTSPDEASAISRDGRRLLRGKGGIVHFAAMRDKGII